VRRESSPGQRPHSDTCVFFCRSSRFLAAVGKAGLLVFLSLVAIARFPFQPLLPSAFAAPTDWRQVNEDGFGHPATDSGTELVVFGEGLYARNEDGLFRMEDPDARQWQEVTTPAAPGSSALSALDGFLYLWNDGKLWFARARDPLTVPGSWQPVTSNGLPGGDSPLPMAVFQCHVYGVTGGGSEPFAIWRSPDLGRTAMQWQAVVTNSFDDPGNNKDIDFLGIFNGRLVAGTQTLKGVFGDPQASASGGVEIWESETGSPGSWTQVNEDGFGTELIQTGTGLKLYTNQVIGSWSVYAGYLYVGTKSHFGAEVWRYDGTGQGGWVNVTPPWAGPGPFGGPGRNESMAVLRDDLYLAEGFPTANLAKYDGRDWSIEVDGPNPFAPENGGLLSLADFQGSLSVSTLHAPYSGITRGDQVWAYTPPPSGGGTFGLARPDLVVESLEATGPAAINAEGSVEVPARVVVRNSGSDTADIFKTGMEFSGPDGIYAVAFTVPGQENIWYPYTSQPLAAGDEVTFEGKVTFHPEDHGITVALYAVADSCSGDEFKPASCRVEERDETNNTSVPICVALP
jgi:hypothetical protein